MLIWFQPMLWFHPLLQLLVTGLSLYVLYTGLQRFAQVHLRKRVVFPWRRHVLLGLVTLLSWGAGLTGGLYTTSHYWRAAGTTGPHFVLALCLLPLLVLGLTTGLVLDQRRKKRRVLPLVHAVGNTLLVLLALVQAGLGIRVIFRFLFL